MDMRMTVFAALGVGALASSCGTLNVQKGLAMSSQLAGASAQAKKCEKLGVEPTVQEEYELGSALAIQWVQNGGGLMLHTDADRALQRYVNTVGKNLAAQSARPTLDWTFGVLDDSTRFNALSTPGGYVFVTRKLLQGVSDEAELAGVLSHEIAHVVMKHSLHQYTSVKVSSCKASVMGKSLLSGGSSQLLVGAADKDQGEIDYKRDPGLLGSMSEKTAEFIHEKGNSSDEEFAADELAAKLMLSAGYDPERYTRFLARITDGANSLANHPKKTDRVKRLVAFVRGLNEQAVKQPDEFAELRTEGLQAPPLPPAFAAAQGASIARDA
jgi:predicted Zn-dependent protease